MYYRIVFDPVADGWLVQVTTFSIWGLLNRWASVKEVDRRGCKRTRVFDTYVQSTEFVEVRGINAAYKSFDQSDPAKSVPQLIRETEQPAMPAVAAPPAKP